MKKSNIIFIVIGAILFLAIISQFFGDGTPSDDPNSESTTTESALSEIETSTEPETTIKEPSFIELITYAQTALANITGEKVKISVRENDWDISKFNLEYVLNSTVEFDGVSKDIIIKYRFDDESYESYVVYQLKIDGKNIDLITSNDNAAELATETTKNANSTKDETQPVTIEPKITIGQQNALKSAQVYLKVMAFSYTGLIEQLEFEKYSHDEAVYGADNCGADWNEQAAKSAETYLKIMAFSRDGLIEQLEFDGYTNAQAVYGANANGY